MVISSSSFVLEILNAWDRSAGSIEFCFNEMIHFASSSGMPISEMTHQNEHNNNAIINYDEQRK